ncbi:TRAP transporter large permease [Aminithiophilus ramosus]|uniref:TRAP transporter large permease n=2 Tax=Synergistales TaxID=649776 RepID=A0A9Q7ANS0_9BACT|nr:TRAP transporter large permease [Aminithiophilus ramosus]QTX32207.1 TRAP transporter large permease [Aminithiophilus ramosus]QVL36075.1 TRAP transporter large permease [Synergistota bacterium]
MLTLMGVLSIAILLGIPIAFAIALSGTAYLLFESTVPVLVVAQRMVVGVDSFTLLAIPLFLLAGALMAEGDITPRIMRFASSLVGHIPGGLAMVMIVSCMLFGAISGSGVADVAAIGSIMLPAMKNQGYKVPFSAALLGCAGSLGTIIPPSIVMVVLGVSMGTSIGKLFLGGIIPGLLTGGALMLISYLFAIKDRYPRMARASAREVFDAFRGAILPLMTPAIIIGGILEGIFTATEAGAVAALYALVLSVFVYRKVTWRRVLEIAFDVARTSAVVLFIISAANLFGWVLTAEDIPQKVASAILALSDNYWVILLLFNLLLLVLGMFMETIAIVIILIPIFFPIMQQLGVDPVHLGVMICVNLAIGANTPPLGIDLITACKVADIPYEDSFRYIFPFLAAMAFALILILFFPALVTFIPNHVFS